MFSAWSSFTDSEECCPVALKITGHSTQDQKELNQSQKTRWRHGETLWKRNSSETFCISRPKPAWDHFCKERLPKTQQTLDAHLRCCTSSGQLWKGKNTEWDQWQCSDFRPCAAQQLRNISTGTFLSSTFSWAATECSQLHAAPAPVLSLSSSGTDLSTSLSA